MSEVNSQAIGVCGEADADSNGRCRVRPPSRELPALDRAVTPRDERRPAAAGSLLEEINASGLPPRGAAGLVCIFPGAAGVHARRGAAAPGGKNAREEVGETWRDYGGLVREFFDG